MSESTEHDWVERARRGEPAAVAELFRRYWRAARAAAYGVTGDLSLAEDAASEAFCAAIDGLATLREANRFGPWLRTITVRTAQRLKTAMAHEVAGIGVCKAETHTPGTRLEQQELAALVHEAVRNLPQALREAISLFYFEGYNVEEAARFLDVPTGTVKRRLHNGRRRLQSAAEQIVQGSKPMNERREQVLKELREAAAQDLNSEAFYRLMREATRSGPLPDEFVRDIWQRHLAARRPQGGPLIPPEREEVIREGWRRLHESSDRARDPNHPVGAVAKAICEALPEFQRWQVDLSRVDVNTAAQQFLENRAQAMSFLLPPGFTEEPSGAYVSLERSPLIEEDDGSVLTLPELIERKASQEALRERLKEGGRLSDALKLAWKQPEPLELRAVEEWLRGLAEKIVPGTPVRFLPRQTPQFRASLRMELGDDPIPAAVGGVANRWSILPEGVQLASITIYLEPWAAAHSGQVIELAKGGVFPWMNRNEHGRTS